jgi:uroporphyrin-III C-methyltransferase/precorrin-2 dehydrogenase/sirohydrochlorin ferrochelatase
MPYLPIFLRLRSEAVVVIGGGQVAARKVELLRRTGARITIVAPTLVEALQAQVTQGELRHIATSFEEQQLSDAALVVAATSSAEVNAAVSAAARQRRIPVNVVDDPEASTFIFPAIVDRTPLIVAVGSNGEAPVLARRIREQLEALLPARLGALARFMGARRKAVQRALAVAARRPFWERVVTGTVGARVLAGDEVGASQDFARELRTSDWTSSPATGGRALGECYLIGAGPGDPDLLTLRALQLLQQADVILYDRLVPQAILERARRDARRIYVGKRTGSHTAQEHINELLVQYARQGLRVARLKGGDPFIFGRGGEEAEILARHAIPFIVVPGITAALGAAASTAIPLTHRDLAQSVTFVTGHAVNGESLDWASLAGPHRTTVFYMGLAQLPRIIEKLRAAGAPPGRPVAIIERATLPEQRTVHGTLASIAALTQAAGVAPPALLIVGDVTALPHAETFIGVEAGFATVDGATT